MRDWVLSGTRGGRSQQAAPPPIVGVDPGGQDQTGVVTVVRPPGSDYAHPVMSEEFNAPVRFDLEGVSPAGTGRLRDGTPWNTVPIEEVRPSGPRLNPAISDEAIREASRAFEGMGRVFSEAFSGGELARMFGTPLFGARLEEVRVTRGQARYSDEFFSPRPFNPKKVFHKLLELKLVSDLVWGKREPRSEQSGDFLLPPCVKKIPMTGPLPRGQTDSRRGSPHDADQVREVILSHSGGVTRFIPRSRLLCGPTLQTDKPRSGPWPERTPKGAKRGREKKQRHARNFGMGLDKQSRL